MGAFEGLDRMLSASFRSSTVWNQKRQVICKVIVSNQNLVSVRMWPYLSGELGQVAAIGADAFGYLKAVEN
jgi:hypothetical protein